MKMKKVLTIAGSDSGGGAGIQADLKAFAARGVFGMTAITALTAQNTLGVHGIFEISAEFVGEQIDAVMNDMGTDAWKTGMLSNAKIIKMLVKKVKEYSIEKLIVDPVMVARSGDSLLHQPAQTALIEDLLPLAYVLTPNHYEAEVITGNQIENLEDAKLAAKEIYEMGSSNVIVKGGHIPGIADAVDVLFDGDKVTEISAPRIDTKNTHGTGCTYASSIAAEIAKGNDIVSAVRTAKDYLTELLEFGKDLKIGKGNGPLDHFLGEEIPF
jgi:hydroxymethylpyrimidine/phosphomethylpyrimidine kinase